MSNPLLRPNDPRFQRPPLRDAAGNNVFADPDSPVHAEPADGAPLPASVVEDADAAPLPARALEPATDNLFAPPAAILGTEQAYQPRYETTHAHRGILLLALAIASLAGDGVLLLILAGTIFGLIGLLAIGPAAIAFLLGRADLAAMRQGAIDDSGATQTRVAMWLGLAGVVLYVAVLAAFALLAVFFALPFVQDG